MLSTRRSASSVRWRSPAFASGGARRWRLALQIFETTQWPRRAGNGWPCWGSRLVLRRRRLFHLGHRRQWRTKTSARRVAPRDAAALDDVAAPSENARSNPWPARLRVDCRQRALARRLQDAAQAYDGLMVAFIDGRWATRAPRARPQYEVRGAAARDAGQRRSLRQARAAPRAARLPGAGGVHAHLGRRTLHREHGKAVGRRGGGDRGGVRHATRKAFASIERVPIASASLAQVHVATERGTGRKLAVKVQHAGLREACYADLAAVGLAVRCAERWFPEFCLGWVVDEIAPHLPLELDFLHEAQNLERCRRLFAASPLGRDGSVVLPDVVPTLTTTRVLAMTFEEGDSVADVGCLRRRGLAPAACASSARPSAQCSSKVASSTAILTRATSSCAQRPTAARSSSS